MKNRRKTATAEGVWPPAVANLVPEGSELEDELQRELDLATAVLERRDLVRARDVRCRPVDEQVGVVEHVVELGAELEAIALRQVEVLVDAAVDVPVAGAAERVPARHVRRERTEVV